MSERVPPIFEHIPREQLFPALKRFRKLTVPFGTPIMEEGDEDPSLICLVEGECDVSTGGVDLGRVGAGQLLGEMALFGGGLRTATVKTRLDSTLLLLDRDAYEALRDEHHPVAQAIESYALQLLTGRLREVGRRIADRAEGISAQSATPDPGLLTRVARLFGGGGGRSRASGTDVLAVLRKAPIFAGVYRDGAGRAGAGDEGYRELASKLQPFSYATGHFLCSQGEYGREMFVLAEGLVEVLVALDETRVEPLATLDPGDAFGTVSLVEDVPRMASCVSRGTVVALSLDRDAYDALVASATPGGTLLRTGIIRSLADQVAYANAQLAMLDIEKKRKTGEYHMPLLRAGAGMDAHGRHLKNDTGEG